MVKILRSVFKPILNIFEKGDEPYNYRPSHRPILVVVAILFLFLAGVSFYFGINAGGAGAFIPAVVFFLAGSTSLIVAGLGNERAVAKIWGSK